MPLCESRTTTCAPFARASSTMLCSVSSWMPKVHSGTKWRGLAIGVYGNAWPMIATGTPLISRSTYGLNTGSPKSGGLHVLREELDPAELLRHRLAAPGRRRR